MSFAEVRSKAGHVRRYAQIMLALLQQEELSRRRNPMEAIVLMLEPIFLIATLTTLFVIIGRQSGSVLASSPVLFFSTGFFIVYFFIFISRRMRRAVDPASRRFPIERRLDYIVIHIALRVFDYAVLSIPLFGIIYVFFDRNALPHDMRPIIGAVAAVAALGFGWGVLNMVIGQYVWVWSRLNRVFTRSLLLFSGVFYVPDFLTPGIRYFLSFNPLLHATGMFRSGFYPHYPKLLIDPTYLFSCALAAVVIGLVVERTMRKSEST